MHEKRPLLPIPDRREAEPRLVVLASKNRISIKILHFPSGPLMRTYYVLSVGDEEGREVWL